MTMTFGQRMAAARKIKGLTQKQLADAAGSIRDIIGRYERDEITPSVEIAAKIADALDTSLDYLVKGILPMLPATGQGQLSPQVVKYSNTLEELPQTDKEHIFAVIDAFRIKANHTK